MYVKYIYYYNIRVITVDVITFHMNQLLLFTGNEHGRAFRDLQLESECHKLTQNLGIGAQFGGKYFCHDVRVVRLPRHGASCPVGIGVSCSADRQVCNIGTSYTKKCVLSPRTARSCPVVVSLNNI